MRKTAGCGTLDKLIVTRDEQFNWINFVLVVSWSCQYVGW